MCDLFYLQPQPNKWIQHDFISLAFINYQKAFLLENSADISALEKQEIKFDFANLKTNVQ